MSESDDDRFFHSNNYNGSQKSEVCPRRPMPYAHGGLCPMPMSTSYESSKGYITTEIRKVNLAIDEQNS